MIQNAATPTVSEPAISTRQGFLALSPAILFLVLYVAVSIAIADFYVMPITVALTASSVWAVAIYRPADSRSHSHLLACRRA